MPAGAIGHNSYPLGSPRTAAAAANPVTFTVPPGLLVAGQNTIAAHVALGYRNTTDISFDLSAVALLGAPDRTPPAAPVPSATLLDESSVRSEEHTSELQSLMRISYAVFCLKKNNNAQQKKHSKDN